MRVQPYLNFNGRCEEALEFYKKAVGAEVLVLMRFGEAPSSGKIAPGSESKVMHSAMRIGETEVMASDGRCTGKTTFDGVSLSLSVDSEPEADRLFKALAEGGQVQMQIGKTFFSPRFGIVTDRFGVSWMVVANPTS